MLGLMMNIRRIINITAGDGVIIIIINIIIITDGKPSV